MIKKSQMLMALPALLVIVLVYAGLTIPIEKYDIVGDRTLIEECAAILDVNTEPVRLHLIRGDSLDDVKQKSKSGEVQDCASASHYELYVL